MTNDTTLLQTFRQGDEAAFATLAERYQHAIRAACQRQAPPGEVDDCVQAVFLVLARRPAAAARAPVLLAWLHRVAHFVCRDARRAEGRRRRTVTTIPKPPAAGHAPDAAVLEQLDTALLGLEERQRAAVLLHAAGNAYDDIAQSLGVTAANASKLVQRGLATLRERLCRTGTPIGAATLVTLISTSGSAAAEVAVPSLSILLAQTSTTKAALLANGALMHVTIAIAKPWIIAAILVAALGTGGMIAADAVNPAPAPAAKEAAAKTIDQILDRRVSLDFQDVDFMEVTDFLRQITLRKITVDPKVIAAGPPKITLRVEDMKLRGVLDSIMELADLKYQISDEAIVIFREDPLAAAPIDKPEALKQVVPPGPTITLKVKQMRMEDAAKWIGELSNVPIKVDPSLRDLPMTFEFQDTNLLDSLEFLAQVTGGEVKPLAGAKPGYQIVPKAPKPDQTPPVPSASQ